MPYVKLKAALKAAQTMRMKLMICFVKAFRKMFSSILDLLSIFIFF